MKLAFLDVPNDITDTFDEATWLNILSSENDNNVLSLLYLQRKYPLLKV